MSKCRETIFRYELIDERDSVVGTLYSKEKRSIPFGEPGENFDLAYSVKETKFLELEKESP